MNLIPWVRDWRPAKETVWRSNLSQHRSWATINRHHHYRRLPHGLGNYSLPRVRSPAAGRDGRSKDPGFMELSSNFLFLQKHWRRIKWPLLGISLWWSGTKCSCCLVLRPYFLFLELRKIWQTSSLAWKCAPKAPFLQSCQARTGQNASAARRS